VIEDIEIPRQSGWNFYT